MGLRFVLGTGEDAPPEKLLYPKPLFFSNTGFEGEIRNIEC
jgi:hypothetical protein